MSAGVSFLRRGGDRSCQVSSATSPWNSVWRRMLFCFLAGSYMGPDFVPPVGVRRRLDNFVHGPARTRFWTSGDKKRWVYAACFVVVVCWPHNSAQSSWFRCLGPVKETFRLWTHAPGSTISWAFLYNKFDSRIFFEKNPFCLPELWAEFTFPLCTLKPADQPPRTPETSHTTSLSGFEGGFTIFILYLF